MNITIITPAKRGDRSGNRATANRWATILRKLGHNPRTITQYDGRPCDAMLAIHAWRSADSILRYRDAFPHSPLIVCLAGTDIYRFQKSHPEATHQSMRHADSLVALHDWVGRAIPKAQRQKLHVIRQSAVPLRRRPPLRRHFEILVAGHLRDEKDPFRTALATRLLTDTSRIQIVHFGKAHEPSYAKTAVREMRENPRYRWFDEVPRWKVRQQMSRARAMVISSRMEGGANVVSEAIMAGLPILASKIDGNVGLLGEDYEGYYSVEDEEALAVLLSRFEMNSQFRKTLTRQIHQQQPKFTQRRELAEWRELIKSITREA